MNYHLFGIGGIASVNFPASNYNAMIIIFMCKNVGSGVAAINISNGVAGIVDIAGSSFSGCYNIAYSNGKLYITSKGYNSWTATVLKHV